jgi:Protein of unknown function (DUF3037)
LTSRYVVFQYLPDPGTGERINIGVATYGDAGTFARFLRNWGRVSSFADQKIEFLREFENRVTDAVASQHHLWADAEVDIAAVFAEASADWINCIQVTAPRASTRSSDALLEDVARRFLRSPARHARSRDRRRARAIAYERLSNALSERGITKPESLLQTDFPIEGAVERHRYDLAVENGHLVTAALALSFEGQNFHNLQREYSAAAWALEDVRNRVPDVPLAVIMLPPASGTSKAYDQARYVFDRLKARSVSEGEITQWAREIAATVVAS